jgi:hypothetical protein
LLALELPDAALDGLELPFQLDCVVRSRLGPRLVAHEFSQRIEMASDLAGSHILG